jgi:hypothetical protein
MPVVSSPPATRGLEGRVIDEGGLPVADATVQLFDHARLWLHEPSGDCAFSLLTCPSLPSGPEVLRRLDAGTLAFPQPVAVVATDVDGHFRFPAVPDDTFLFITHGSDTLLHEFDDDAPLTLHLEGEASTRVIVIDGAKFVGGVPFVLISPFTRSSDVLTSEANGGEVQGEAARFAWLMALPLDGGRSTVALPAQRNRIMRIGTPRSIDVRVVTEDGGSPGVDGVVGLVCGEDRFVGRTDGGVVRFTDVIAYNCKLEARWSDFSGDPNQLLETWRPGERLAMLRPRARLALAVSGELGTRPLTAVVTATSDDVFAAFDKPWGKVSFDGGTALLEGLPVGPAQVTVRGPGVAPSKEVIALVAGLNRLNLVLEASPAVSGRVRDVEGRPVDGASVSAFLEGTRRWLGDTRTDARGSFRLDVNTVENVRLEVVERRRGAATANVPVADARDAGLVELVLAAPRALEVVPLQPDGGPLRARIELKTPAGEHEVGVLPDSTIRLMEFTDEWTALRVDDGGVARETQLEPGPHVVRATARGWVTSTQVVTLADAGLARVAIVLEPGQVVQGMVRLAGKPLAGVSVWHEDAGVITNGEGRFRFEDLAAGRRQLLLTNEDGSRTHPVTVTAPDQAVVIELPE